MDRLQRKRDRESEVAFRFLSITLTGEFLGAGAEKSMPSLVQTFMEETKLNVFRLTDSNSILHDVCYEVVLDIVAEDMTELIACITNYRFFFDRKSIEMIVTGLSAAEEAMTNENK